MTFPQYASLISFFFSPVLLLLHFTQTFSVPLCLPPPTTLYFRTFEVFNSFLFDTVSHVSFSFLCFSFCLRLIHPPKLSLSLSFLHTFILFSVEKV